MSTELINASSQAIADCLISFNTSMVEIGQKVDNLENLSPAKLGKKYAKLSNKLFQAINPFVATLEAQCPILDSESRALINSCAFLLGSESIDITSLVGKPEPAQIAELLAKLSIIATTSEILQVNIDSIAKNFATYQKRDWLDKAIEKLSNSANILSALASYTNETIAELKNIDHEDAEE
jgi:hypothetical protein